MKSVSLALLFTTALAAQFAGLSLPPSGNNQPARVEQGIGPAHVSVSYSSPAVHGPASPGSTESVDRRGKIWGGLVPFGLTDLGFGHRQPAPWRAGANENTVFTASHDVLINGQPLAAGKYGVHMIAGPEEWTIIFSRNAGEWGSFFYEPKNDALRVTAKPRKNTYREYLTYDFPVRKPAEATVEMQWEDLAVGWTIQVPDPREIYLSQVRQQLHNSVGFSWQAWVAASQWCAEEGLHLEEALGWAEYAISGAFVGQENFQTLGNKALVLGKLGRTADAAETMQRAIRHETATATQIHQYGRQLLSGKQNQEAMAVFEWNAKRFGEQWPTHVGLARGYAAMGEKTKALEHARKALAQAPDAVNRSSLQGMIDNLSK